MYTALIEKNGRLYRAERGGRRYEKQWLEAAGGGGCVHGMGTDDAGGSAGGESVRRWGGGAGGGPPGDAGAGSGGYRGVSGGAGAHPSPEPVRRAEKTVLQTVSRKKTRRRASCRYGRAPFCLPAHGALEGDVPRQKPQDLPLFLSTAWGRGRRFLPAHRVNRGGLGRRGMVYSCAI